MQNLNFKLNYFGIGLIFLFAVITIFPVHREIDFERNHMFKQQPVFYDSPKQLFFGILGEFRATIADILWVKVDEYFHSGLSEEEHQRIHPGHKDWHPSPHSLRSGQAEAEMMPLIRFVTWLDPQFLQGYQVGAWWLCYKLNKTDEAIAFLQEGIRNNPTRYEGYSDLGWIYYRQLKNYPVAKSWFIAALRNTSTPEDKATLQFTIGAIDDLLGNKEEAKQLWLKVAQSGIDPHAAAAKRRLNDLN